jgi:hypothetical protein
MLQVGVEATEINQPTYEDAWGVEVTLHAFFISALDLGE